MESSIEFKGLIFVNDEGIGSQGSGIYAIQGTTNKLSCNLIPGKQFIVSFVILRETLFAITSGSNILKLREIKNGTGLDDWEDVGIALYRKASFAVLFKDLIYIFNDNAYTTYDGIEFINVTYPTDPSVDRLLNGLVYKDSLYAYGLESDKAKIYKFDESGVDAGWVIEYEGNPFIAATMDFSFYRASGKSLIVENRGKIYFTEAIANIIDYYLIAEYDLDSKRIVYLDNVEKSLFAYTSLNIQDDVLLIALLDFTLNVSNVKTYPLKKFTFENKLISGDGDTIDKLWRIESDPVLPSILDKEQLMFSPRYMCLVQLKGTRNSLVKYGNRREFYTNLDDSNALIGANLKDIVDDLSNAMNSYLAFRPENTIEIGIDDTIGKSNAEYILTDDGIHKDVRIREFVSSEKGINNFKRVIIGWKDSLGTGEETVGTISTVGTEEFSFSSIIINDPLTARNIATYLFGKMTDSEMYTLKTDFAPFLRENYNILIKAIDKFIYLNDKDEYKILEVNNDFEGKSTEIKILKRNIKYETFI